MKDRHKDHIRRRSSVFESNQTDHLDDDRYETPSQHTRPGRKLIPLLMFAAVGFLIAWNEIPAVNNAWDRIFSPDKWMAKQTCQKAAVEQSQRKEFARLLKPGKVNKTNDGIYIDRLIIGEMGQSGDEERVEYSCYLDSGGKLVKLNRLGTPPAPVAAKLRDHLEE